MRSADEPSRRRTPWPASAVRPSPLRSRVIALLATAGLALGLAGCAGGPGGGEGLRYQLQRGARHDYTVGASLRGSIAVTPEQSAGQTGADQSQGDQARASQQTIPVQGSLAYDLDLRVGAVEGGVAEITQEVRNGSADVAMGQQGGPQTIPPIRLTVRMDELGRVRDVKGLETLQADVAFLNARHFREMMAQVFPAYPQRRAQLKPGDKWTESVVLEVYGADQPVRGSIETVYKGLEKREGRMLHRLESRAVFPVKMTRQAAGGLFTIEGKDEVTTTSFVDPGDGFPVSAATRIVYRADQTVDQNGQKTKMKFDLVTELEIDRYPR